MKWLQYTLPARCTCALQKRSSQNSRQLLSQRLSGQQVSAERRPSIAQQYSADQTVKSIHKIRDDEGSRSGNACLSSSKGLIDSNIHNRRAVIIGLTVLAAAACTPLASHAALVDEDNAERVFKSTAASVVSIAAFRRKGNEEIAEGTGSGFVWSKSGFIVTNYHCIAKLAQDRTGTQATMVGIEDDSGQTQQWEAEVVGSDPSHDLAVLQIQAPASALAPIKVGSSTELRVGQSVFAIGFPLGFSKTLTAGVVSGLNRGIPSPGGTITTGAIQTDAAISSGNSGGPLLDSSGRLVGVSTATFSSSMASGRSSGVNFALPASLVLNVVGIILPVLRDPPAGSPDAYAHLTDARGPLRRYSAQRACMLGNTPLPALVQRAAQHIPGVMAQTVNTKLVHQRDTYEATVPAYTTFGQLKETAAGLTGIPMRHIKLTFKGREKPDHDTLLGAGVRNGNKIFVGESEEYRNQVAERREAEELATLQREQERLMRGAQASSSASYQHPKPEILSANAPPAQPAQSDTERSVEAIGKITAVVDDLEAKVNVLEPSSSLEGNKDAIRLMEMLTRQLLDLDSIQVTPESRHLRKAQVNRINALCDKLELMKATNGF